MCSRQFSLALLPTFRWVASLAANCKKYHLGDFDDEVAAAAHHDLAKKAHEEGRLAEFLAAQSNAKNAHKQAAAKEKSTAAAAAAAAAQSDLEGKPLLVRPRKRARAAVPSSKTKSVMPAAPGALPAAPSTAAPTAVPLGDTVNTAHTLLVEEHRDGADITELVEV